MKAIELTEKHKEMLLEMCKILFPEIEKHGVIQIIKHLHIPGEYENVIEELNEHETNFIQFLSFAKVKDNGFIHWFEFSWKILNKILEVSQMSPLKVQKEIILYGLICFNDFESYHPVEHLYILFNKHFNSTKSC